MNKDNYLLKYAEPFTHRQHLNNIIFSNKITKHLSVATIYSDRLQDSNVQHYQPSTIRTKSKHTKLYNYPDNKPSSIKYSFCQR